MQPERWRKIERIFSQAVAVSPVDRNNFLARTCGDDFDLREEISSMLVEDSDEEFLSEPIFDLGAQLLDADDLPREREFGSYQLQKLLGRGGMGAVYLARDMRLERLVALKVLPASVADNEEVAARFRQEARAASLVSHPNVAHIYEFGENGGCRFLAMEYVAGKTLRELLKEKSLDEATILDIARQIAAALAATQRSGVVHRDIKPENIIVAADGAIKVLDFGLAKPDTLPTATGENKFTSAVESSSGLIIGTTAYMSPEQIRGKAVDSRTDLWSFGVVLFEMLAGKRPFAGEAASELQTAILLKDVAADDCPQKFRSIVGKLLQKNPADRYQSAEDLLTDLQRLKAAPDEVKRSRRFADIIKKYKTVVIIGSLILLLGLLAAGFRNF
jgi:serine/threonine protein kinase